MPNFQAVECDLIVASTAQKLCTVQLPIMLQVGDELDVDGRTPGDGLYRVVRVRYHVRPRKFTTRDDLFGVSVFVEPTA